MGRRKRLQEGRSFFKFFVGDFTNKLRIPPVFVKHFRGVFPEKCKICRPRIQWHVQVIKDGNDFFLGDGWSDFVHDNALEFGDLLLFKHEGKSKLSVRIYGKNACEKDLVFPTTRTGRAKHGKSSCENKLVLAANNTGVISHIKQENENEDKFGEEGKILTALEAFDKYAYQKTYFKCQLRPGHMKEKRLNVPLDFVKKMVNESGQSVMLQVADKLWPVKVYFHPNISARIYAGWGEFMKDNNLQVGDVCIFERSQTNNMVINVSIFGPTS